MPIQKLCPSVNILLLASLLLTACGTINNPDLTSLPPSPYTEGYRNALAHSHGDECPQREPATPTSTVTLTPTPDFQATVIAIQAENEKIDAAVRARDQAHEAELMKVLEPTKIQFDPNYSFGATYFTYKMSENLSEAWRKGSDRFIPEPDNPKVIVEGIPGDS